LHWDDWVLIVFGLIALLVVAAYLKIRSIENSFPNSSSSSTGATRTFTTDLLAAYKSSSAPTIIPSYLNQLLGVFQQLHDAKPPGTPAAYNLCLQTCSASLIGFAQKAPGLLLQPDNDESVFKQYHNTETELFRGSTFFRMDPSFETGALQLSRPLWIPSKTTERNFKRFSIGPIASRTFLYCGRT
jgi:hypothetical protein